MKRHSEAWFRRAEANAGVLEKAGDRVRHEDWWRFYRLVAAQASYEIPATRWREIVAHAVAELKVPKP